MMDCVRTAKGPCADGSGQSAPCTSWIPSFFCNLAFRRVDPSRQRPRISPIGPDRILGYLFHCADRRTVINCSQLIMGPLGPTHFQRWGCRGRNSYTYACSDSRIDSFVALSGEHDEPQQSFSGELRYRPNGTVELWRKEGRNKKPVLYYQGRPPRDNPFVRHFISTWRGFA